MGLNRDASSRRSSALRHRPRRLRSARLAQKEEDFIGGSWISRYPITAHHNSDDATYILTLKTVGPLAKAY